MTLRENICAVVTPDTLHIYALPVAGEAALLQTLYLSHVVENAAMSKEQEGSPLACTNMETSEEFLLFITNKAGLYVYRILQQTALNTFSAEMIVEEETTESNSSRSPRSAFPCFGGSASRVSWIRPPASLFDRQSGIVTAQMQRTEDGDFVSQCQAKLAVVAEFKSAGLPSLHSMPVMDFDDGAGLLVVGNSRGQLALCNFGGPLPDDYCQCLREIPIPLV